MEPEAPMSHKAAVAIVAAYSDEERTVLLNWARQVIAIREGTLPFTQKALRIARLTNELGLTKPLVRHLLVEIRRVGWTERSKGMKGVIGGAGVGLLASVAGPMAGVAAFGSAVAVPVVLLGMGGGALITAIVEELSSKKKQ
jgi:hypothetical protein